MYPALLAVFVSCTGLTSAAQNAPELFSFREQIRATGGGEILENLFFEIQRGPNFSNVEIKLASFGSVSSSMFILQGMCGLASARREQFFRPTQVSKKPVQYRVSFLSEPVATDLSLGDRADIVFSKDQCAKLNF